MNAPLIQTKDARLLEDSEILGISTALDIGEINNDFSKRKAAAVMRDYVELRRAKSVQVQVRFTEAEVSEIFVRRCERLQMLLDETDSRKDGWKEAFEKTNAERDKFKMLLDSIVTYALENKWREDKDQEVSVNTCARLHNTILDDIIKIVNGEKK